MAITGTFNGQSVIALPTSPGFKSLELISTDTNSVSTSPYTGSQQVQNWPGGDYWSGSIELPKMDAASVGIWRGFQNECRGQLNVFQVGDPLRRQPLGVAQGLPLINGAHAAMLTSISTKGWKASTYRQLIAGDYLQIGYRLHVVLDQVNSDANGNAVISIWPSLREALTDGAVIILNNPVGLFRLASNSRSIMADATRLHALSTLKIMEAR